MALNPQATSEPCVVSVFESSVLQSSWDVLSCTIWSLVLDLGYSKLQMNVVAIFGSKAVGEKAASCCLLA